VLFLIDRSRRFRKRSGNASGGRASKDRPVGLPESGAVPDGRFVSKGKPARRADSPPRLSRWSKTSTDWQPVRALDSEHFSPPGANAEC